MVYITWTLLYGLNDKLQYTYYKYMVYNSAFLTSVCSPQEGCCYLQNRNTETLVDCISFLFTCKVYKLHNLLYKIISVCGRQYAIIV